MQCISQKLFSRLKMYKCIFNSLLITYSLLKKEGSIFGCILGYTDELVRDKFFHKGLVEDLITYRRISRHKLKNDA